MIIGSKNTLNLPNPILTEDQKAERDDLLKKRENTRKELDVFYDSYKEKYGFLKAKRKEAQKNDEEYQKVFDKYLSICRSLSKLLPRKKTHGYVWVSLRK